MTAYTDDLFLAAQEAYQSLWPGQITPTDPADLRNDLQLSKVHVGEWRDSGARVGADEALTYFLSWYKKADLETLHSMREGSAWTTDPDLIRRRQKLAHSYVDYANTEVFVRDIHEPEKKDEAEDAEGSDSSQDEEETEDAGNTGDEALTQRSALAGGDASIPSTRSGTPDANVSTATAPPAGGSASAPAS
jgi:hypothetical protein